ncbi:hypothetical protein AGMMS49975_26090 [Clostridia bacterium]|nr:hypothetical protein AGMMS49975_26090 [Clostridia bacterium]
MNDRILPTNDLGFKKTFADTANLDILRGLINDFFGLNPVDIIIQNPYSIETYKKILKEAEENGESVILRQTLRTRTQKIRKNVGKQKIIAAYLTNCFEIS